VRLAKEHQITILLIGHVTKEGSIAGPKMLEHMVDTVLYFEGEMNRQFRLVRAFKNRFGSTNELGIFEMHADGLHEVTNPSRLFLRHTAQQVPGSVVTAAVEGTRPLLVEIQALVTPSSGFGAPRRTVSGIDTNRLAIILAVLEKKMKLKFSQHDVFVNVVGGVDIDEPAADLAIALAVISSLNNQAIPGFTAAFGELGLGGELRPVSQGELRLQEIKKLGFERVILPPGLAEVAKRIGLAVQEAATIQEIQWTYTM
jgi:DNA repair protein RadA/Sms